MVHETDGTITFRFDSDTKEWVRYTEGDSIITNTEIWSISGRWNYQYTYRAGDSYTIIEFDLEILGFDGKTLNGSYYYYIEDKPLFRSIEYSEDEDSGDLFINSGYMYISNLYSDNYGRTYNYYVELYDSTLEGHTQPCFIVDKDEGVLILTGHEQWNPLREVTRLN